MVGYDYGLFFPPLLDSAVHFRNNGFSILWYTPSFGGGVPSFPNPQDLQLSLLEILLLWIPPWQVVSASSIFYISLGFIASIRFFQKVLKLTPEASILGAIFFSANGFVMQRMAVGHLSFQPFPMFAVILLLFFDPALSTALAGVLLGVMSAFLIYQAGFFVVVIFGLSSLIVFQLVRIIQPEIFSWKRIFMLVVLGCLIALLLSASKLSAVYSFMRFFPRQLADVYSVSLFSALFGVVLQLLGTMNLVPFFSIARLDYNLLTNYLIHVSGAYYGFWEFDMSMSPLVFGIILAGATKLFYAPRKYLKHCAIRKNCAAVLLFIFFVWLVVEFTLATGWFYPHLRQMPILSSLHVNARFAAAFIFPLAFLAAVIYDSWNRRWSQKRSAFMFILANILTLVPLSTYFMFTEDIQSRTYDVTGATEVYQSIRAGEKFAVSAIDGLETGSQALQTGSSNLYLREPLFGYALEDFHPEIKAGSIWDVSNGYFNMTNPSGYVFPEINQTRPFERIKIQDRENLEAFANYLQPKWKIPLYQKICNWISALTLVFVIFSLPIYSFGFPRIEKPLTQ